jgi:hypothetical protein
MSMAGRKKSGKDQFWMRIDLTADQQERLGIAAAIDGRSKRSFARRAVVERIDMYVDDSLESPFFVPPGLRASGQSRAH